jgi:hypothetical protein
MLLPPIPVDRYLVPEPLATAPEGFTLASEPILQGLPHTLRLSPTATVQVLLLHGLAVPWRDADSAAVVTRSDPERGSLGPAAPPHVPLRFVLRINDTQVAAAPVVAGRPFTLPDGAGDGVRYEFVILSWDIRAGSLRGPGAFGSQIAFGWRAANAAVDAFSPPPVPFNVVARLPETARLKSELGIRQVRALPRFVTLKRTFIR